MSRWMGRNHALDVRGTTCLLARGSLRQRFHRAEAFQRDHGFLGVARSTSIGLHVRIGWLNPSIGSKNLGDQIIEAAVAREVADLLPTHAAIEQLPTQRFLGLAERRRAAHCDAFLVGGTNLVNGNIPRYLQWRIDPHSARIYSGRTSLLGVGWWQYQDLNALSSRIWQYVLKNQVHSVRDQYTANRFSAMGLRAINTGCPTMWRLPAETTHETDRRRVVATITDYHRDPRRDKRMLDALAGNYDEVLVWLQGSKDRAYLAELGARVQFVAPSLAAFDEVLNAGDIDYFGTRLHAGVRALQFGVRATVVAIDNRAREISKDTGLPIVSNNFEPREVEESKARLSTNITLDHAAIESWKLSFRSAIGV